MPNKDILPYIQTSIDDKVLYAFLDTGAVPISVISENVYRDLHSLKNKKLEAVSGPIFGVSGNQLDVLGCIDVTITIAQFHIRHKFVVARNVRHSIILGWDFLVANEVDFHMSDLSIVIQGVKVPLLTKEELIPISCSVVVNEKIVVPKCSEMVVPLRLVTSNNSDTHIMPDYAGIFEPETNENVMLNVACTATVSRRGIIPVLVMNISQDDITLYENTPVGNYYSTTEVMGEVYEIVQDVSFSQFVPSERYQKHDPYPESFPPERNTCQNMGKPYPPVDLSDSVLTSDQKEKVQSFIDEYDDVFSKHSRDLGRTNLVRHKIDLIDSNLPKQRPYRVSPKLREELRTKIDDLIEDDLIELSTSNFAAPALLVRKKSPDNSKQYRLVLDYRATNLITLKDSHALPRIDDSIDALHGNLYFSTLDLSSGFWQVEMDPNDREKTSFSTGDGLYQWKVMPMGLKNSSATFQRLMELAFRGMHWTKVCFFIDDVIIFGKNFQEKMANLREAFDRLRDAGLKVRPDKCQIFCKEVTFLGHTVSHEGVKPDRSNIEKVEKWPRPKDVTSLRGFLGLTGFYRRFVQDYAKISQPLLHLTKKGISFDWNDDCEHAFTVLRNALISPPILQYPNYGSPFTLYVDASACAIGSVLAQKGSDGKEHVIGYASHSLTDSERKWSTYDRELWAVVWSTRHFRRYLQCTNFLIVTDHKPLVGLKKMPLDQDPAGRRARWAVQMDLLDWEIVYKPGKSHVNADAMSRRNQTDPVIDHNQIKPSLISSQDNFGKVHSVMQKDESQTNYQDQNFEFRSYVQELEAMDNQNSNSSSFEKDNLQDHGDFSLANNGERLSRMQKQDPDIREVLSWINTRSIPSKAKLRNKPRLLKYRNVYRHLVVRNGILWRKYKQEGKSTILQAVIPADLVVEILPQLHGSTMSGHYGIQKTVQKALQLYFWPLMYRDISRFCQSCEICQRDRDPVPKYRAPLKPISVTRPLQIVAADIVEFGLTSSGNRYVLVVTDYYTKYANMYPIKDQTADTVAECLFVNYVRQHSIPECILSDQGVQFESQVTQSLCKKLGITKVHTSSAHPQCDGQTERMNRTIRAQLVRNSLSAVLLKNMQSTQNNDWDQFIPQIEFAYNTTVHATTGLTPFYMLHARDPRLPVNVMFGSEEMIPENNSTVKSKVDQVCRRYNQAAKLVKHVNKKAKIQQKRQYDKRVRFKQYEIGQLVYLTNPRAVRSKLAPRWLGPFRVIQKFNDGLNYQIIDANARAAKAKIVHYNRLKPRCQFDQEELFGKSEPNSFQIQMEGDEPEDKQLENIPSRSGFLRSQQMKEMSKQKIKSQISKPGTSESPSVTPDKQAALREARKFASDRQAALRAASQLSTPVKTTRSGRVVKPPVKLNL